MIDHAQRVGSPEQLKAEAMFAHREDGSRISREARCECGATFTQHHLSKAYLEKVESRKGGLRALMQQTRGDYYLPVFCPKCERMDIEAHARRADFRLAGGGEADG